MKKQEQQQQEQQQQQQQSLPAFLHRPVPNNYTHAYMAKALVAALHLTL